jgi:hypothetical protein
MPQYYGNQYIDDGHVYRCKVCKQAIPRTQPRGTAFGGCGRVRIYCSNACRQAAKRARAKETTGVRRKGTA